MTSSETAASTASWMVSNWLGHLQGVGRARRGGAQRDEQGAREHRGVFMSVSGVRADSRPCGLIGQARRDDWREFRSGRRSRAASFDTITSRNGASRGPANSPNRGPPDALHDAGDPQGLRPAAPGTSPTRGRGHDDEVPTSRCRRPACCSPSTACTRRRWARASASRGGKPGGDRRPLRRGQGGARRLLDDRREVEGRGDRVGARCP
jgi:hypothetical protein